jgi:hypothetical protein
MDGCSVESMTTSKQNYTSSLVIGWPSEKRAPRRMWNVTPLVAGVAIVASVFPTTVAGGRVLCVTASGKDIDSVAAAEVSLRKLQGRGLIPDAKTVGLPSALNDTSEKPANTIAESAVKRSSLTLRGGPHNATAEERRTFNDALAGVQMGMQGTLSFQQHVAEAGLPVFDSVQSAALAVKRLLAWQAAR